MSDVVTDIPAVIRDAVQRLADESLARPLTQGWGGSGLVMMCPNGFHVNLNPSEGGRWYCSSGQHRLLPVENPPSDIPQDEAFAGEYAAQDVPALLERVARWPLAPAVQAFG